MKITDVRTVLLTGPSTNDPFLRELRKRRSVAIIEIVTVNRGYYTVFNLHQLNRIGYTVRLIHINSQRPAGCYSAKRA